MKNASHAQAGQNLFMSSVTGLANVLAVMASFFGAPTLYGYSAPFVQQMTYQSYGPDIATLAMLVWWIISYLLVFYIARATVGTALIFGGLAIVTRLM